jgi:hypothetical protein
VKTLAMISGIKSDNPIIFGQFLSGQTPIVEHAKNAMQNVNGLGVIFPVNAIIDQVGHVEISSRRYQLGYIQG